MSEVHMPFEDLISRGLVFERGGRYYRRLHSGKNKPVKTQRQVKWGEAEKTGSDESTVIVKGCQKNIKNFLLYHFQRNFLRRRARIPADDACLKSAAGVSSKLEQLVTAYEVETKQAAETGLMSPECWRFCVHAAKLMEAFARLANTQKDGLFLRDRLKSRKPVNFPAKLEDLVRSWNCYLAKFKKQQ